MTQKARSTMTTDSFKNVGEQIRALPNRSFTNEFGEKFTVYTNGITVYMSGDEVGAMVPESAKFTDIIPLFNARFDMWSKDELNKLGKALQELTEE